jgi:protein-S-isoprenylcysteine O-methyltransferase Ste14
MRKNFHSPSNQFIVTTMRAFILYLLFYTTLSFKNPLKSTKSHVFPLPFINPISSWKLQRCDFKEIAPSCNRHLLNAWIDYEIVDEQPMRGKTWNAIKSKLNYLRKETIQLFDKLKNRYSRQILYDNLKEEISYRWSNFKRNMSYGELGKRYENLTFLLAFLVLTIFIGIPPILSLLIQLSGSTFVLWGLFQILNGLWSLHNNVSIYVVPVNGSFVVTEGAYADVRHPIYGGILLLCLGVSMLSNSMEKMFTTMIIYSILVGCCSTAPSLSSIDWLTKIYHRKRWLPKRNTF